MYTIILKFHESEFVLHSSVMFYRNHKVSNYFLIFKNAKQNGHVTLISEQVLGKLVGACGRSGNCKEKQMNEEAKILSVPYVSAQKMSPCCSVRVAESS